MKRVSPWLTTIITAILFYSCQKSTPDLISSILKERFKNISNFIKVTTDTNAICGTPMQVNLVDNYPTQFYMTYGTIKVSNDANNVYVTLNSLIQYNFYFSEIKLTVGDLPHLQAMVPYYDYNVGPPTSDYTQNFTSAVSSYTFTIPKSKISGNCFNVFVWATEVKSDKSDFHNVWVQSNTKTVLNPNSSYINYCLQTCSTTGGNGGNGDEDDDDDEHEHEHDNDHGDHHHHHGDHEHGNGHGD